MEDEKSFAVLLQEVLENQRQGSVLLTRLAETVTSLSQNAGPLETMVTISQGVGQVIAAHQLNSGILAPFSFSMLASNPSSSSSTSTISSSSSSSSTTAATAAPSVSSSGLIEETEERPGGVPSPSPSAAPSSQTTRPLGQEVLSSHAVLSSHEVTDVLSSLLHSPLHPRQVVIHTGGHHHHSVKKEYKPLNSAQKRQVRKWAQADGYKDYNKVVTQDGFSVFYTELTNRFLAEMAQLSSTEEWDVDAVRSQLITYRRSLHTTHSRGRKLKAEARRKASGGADEGGELAEEHGGGHDQSLDPSQHDLSHEQSLDQSLESHEQSLDQSHEQSLDQSHEHDDSMASHHDQEGEVLGVTEDHLGHHEDPHHHFDPHTLDSLPTTKEA